MSQVLNGRSFFVEVNFSLVFNILQQARDQSWVISNDNIAFINTYQNNILNVNNSEKISYLSQMLASCLLSKNTDTKDICKRWLGNIFEIGIEAIFEKAKTNKYSISENEANMIGYYHDALPYMGDEKILAHYRRICLSVESSFNFESHFIYINMHNNLYQAHTNLLQGQVELIFPQAAALISAMKNSSRQYAS